LELVAGRRPRRWIVCDRGLPRPAARHATGLRLL